MMNPSFRSPNRVCFLDFEELTSLVPKMKLSPNEKSPFAKVENTDSAKAAIQKTSGTGMSAVAAAAQHKRPRRVIRLRPQHATPLDTVDDDEYDDCWLPAYEDPEPIEKPSDGGWLSVKKPAPSR
ncbi:hypothetical protein LX36DRAFT_674984 [Colletotrichum falcatum]|nr:hypothetical protein LX36DRAFT_674984 [Colletotrichum falcatum]